MKKAHNRTYYVSAGVIISALLIASMYVYVITPRGEPLLIQKSDDIFLVVQDGDIICRLGDRLWSQFFSDLSAIDKRYSHIGIVHRDDDLITVINAEGDTARGKDFVHEVPFDDFLKAARAVGVYRMENVEGSRISNAALEYLGIPFDWQFDMNDESKLYCTELLYVVLKRVAPELNLNTVYLKELGKEIIPPESVSNSDYFVEIYFNGSGQYASPERYN
ncbi:MAG: hypothetical protein LBD07_03030 [Spirochaetaceae bacterium]|jgi:hypothetical protein|nr:hypothetical protein [Spirochaetaceae bacterium]